VRDFFDELCEVERDRATAAEVCIDELLTIMGRHNIDGTAYNMLTNLSAAIHEGLCEADGLAKRHERLSKIRSRLTSAFPMTDADLGIVATPAQSSKGE
jgi:hypothetical protein